MDSFGLLGGRQRSFEELSGFRFKKERHRFHLGFLCSIHLEILVA